jgi:membrane protease YdiL (CAAX protease family)
MEELLFRGLFLKRFAPLLGKGLSNLLTAIVFTLMHIQVTYTPQMLQFLLIVLTLSLVWGYLIQKTNSLWGAVLFHAAGDCLIIFAAFASM